MDRRHSELVSLSHLSAIDLLTALLCLVPDEVPVLTVLDRAPAHESVSVQHQHLPIWTRPGGERLVTLPVQGREEQTLLGTSHHLQLLVGGESSQQREVNTETL